MPRPVKIIPRPPVVLPPRNQRVLVEQQRVQQPVPDRIAGPLQFQRIPVRVEQPPAQQQVVRQPIVPPRVVLPPVVRRR